MRGAIAIGRACLLTLAAALATFAWQSDRARADVFGTTSLLSASPFGQAEYAHDPAISEDGRYVVFDGSVAGIPGVWRRRNEAGAAFEQVAGGDAALPSISADGQYVSFTTNEGASLPAITDEKIQTGTPVRESPGVYVRNMDLAPNEAEAFKLASAKNGSTQSLEYEYADPSSEGERDSFGATAAARSAITADGQTVVFVTTARSDLDGPGTPPLQVAVRHLQTHETQLVSVRLDPVTGRPAVNPETGGPEPVPEQEGYGAVDSLGGPPGFQPRGNSLAEAYEIPELAGASISADGSTVAWLGQQVTQQARTLSGEELRPEYAEPLWRRIAAGPSEPTRRVTGGSQPEAPGCEEHPEPRLPTPPVAGDPCQGPFATQTTGFGLWNHVENADVTPRLSADGDDVAFIASAPLVSNYGGFGLGAIEYTDDAYWAEMKPPYATSTLRQLTQFASGEKERISTNAEIEDIGISPDGRQVAFTTRRTVFPLGNPAFVSVPAAVPGLMELYDADLANSTLTRVTRGYEGGAPAHPEEETGKEDPYQHQLDGSLSPSFSADGDLLAFSSTASNLVYGDGNTPALGARSDFADGADVFVIQRQTFEPEPTPQSISPAPSNPTLEAPWGLGVSASSLSDGAVRLRIALPAAGQLTLSAHSTLIVAARGHRKARRIARTVAHMSRVATPDQSGVVELQLQLESSYSKLAGRAGGLTGRLTVDFTAAGHTSLEKTIAIRFLRRGRAARRKP